MVFNTNQNRHLYVATTYSDSVTNASSTGYIGNVKAIGAGPEKEIYFLYKGPDTVLKSDRIQLKNLEYIKKITPAEMRVPLKKLEITIASAALSDSKPIVGQDYVLRINLRQFYGMSDQDQYFKDAAVHVTSGMTVSEFYIAMMKSLNRAFSREIGSTKTSNPYLKFEVYNTYSGDNTLRDEDYYNAHTSGVTATKLVITEKAQEYTRGIQAKERVYFDVVPTTVCINTADVVSGSSVTVVYENRKDVIWGEVEDVTPHTYVLDTDNVTPSPTYGQMILNEDLVAGTNAIGNGYALADLEWFCMGERGDQYRMAGWPNYVPTTYLVNPTSEYYVLELHFAFTDTGVNSYRSEKDITIISTTQATIDNMENKIKNIAGLNDVPNLKQWVGYDRTEFTNNGSVKDRLTTIEEG